LRKAFGFFWQDRPSLDSRQPMRVKAPNILLVQRRERPEFSLEDLLAGGAGVVSENQWLALAPHIGLEVIVTLEDLALLAALIPGTPTERDELVVRFGEAVVAKLIDAGLLIGDHAGHASLRGREQALTETGWWAPAAVAHSFGRWQGIDVGADAQATDPRALAKLLEAQGLPPSETLELRPREDWLPLPAPAKTALDELMAGRATCRNFDPDFSLPLAELSAVLHRVFGAQGSHELAPGAVALKKNSPSGGGLHPIEAYLLVQRVDGLPPGLYHYHSTGHALVPLQSLPTETIAPSAYELVAGQSWFANAPVLVLMAARFQRNFWKYRNHPKAWKVIQLDAGHLSQNLYLSATELGYGAFVTGAINDECAERLFGLDGLSVGAIAVCGFGRRANQIVTTELDPLGKAVR
jgi:putative peptide maturation dehydrogenase